MKRIHYYTDPQGNTVDGLTLTEIKKRIRQKGGSGYTYHFDRDGSFQECTPIVLGNNARTTYRAEYNDSRKFRNNRGPAGQENGQIDVQNIIKTVIGQAEAENLNEEDNWRLMELLTSGLGPSAPRISERWYDEVLSLIHARLFHEWRGMGRYGRRMDAIRKWKQENQ